MNRSVNVITSAILEGQIYSYIENIVIPLQLATWLVNDFLTTLIQVALAPAVRSVKGQDKWEH